MVNEFNKAQQQVIDIVDGNVVVNATAGSGKTSVIIARIKNLVENHHVRLEKILAISFSTKACDTLRERGIAAGLDAEKFEVRTFHSLALEIYKDYNKIPDTKFVMTDRFKRDRYLEEVLPDSAPYGIEELREFITIAKQQLISPAAPENTFKKINRYYHSMRKCYIEYEKLKSANGGLKEFDDFIMLALEIFQNNPIIQKKYQDKFSHILVDEFQDIDYGQYIFISSISNGHNLMVVGDVFQAIYGFRGGDSSYLFNFHKNHNDTTVISMNTNYRSNDKIISLANKVCDSLPESLNEYYIPAVASSTSKTIPKYKVCKNEWDEGNFIAKRIIKNNMDYNDVCVLARTNAQLQVIQNCLSTHNIPFYAEDGKGFLEIPEIKTMIAYIEFAHNPQNNKAFLEIYDKPKRWLGEKFISELEVLSRKYNISYYEAMIKIKNRYWGFAKGMKQIQGFVEYMQKQNPRNIGTLIGHIRKRVSFDKYVLTMKHVGVDRSAEALENLNAFQELCRPIKTYSDLANVLNKIKADSKADANGAVRLMTIHRAKGLEFPKVFVIGCSDGLLPHIRNNDDDEERKIFYVAVTRPIDELYLTRSQKYQNRIYDESPFIADLENTIKTIK